MSTAHSQALQELDAIIAAVEQTMPKNNDKAKTKMDSSTTATTKKEEKKKQGGKGKASATKSTPADEESMQFQKAELQVSRIVKAQKHPNADALMQLEVEVGNDLPNRQIIAGIYKYYKPEELEGRFIVTILNLKPIKLVGLDSRGMLLAGSNDTYRAEGEERVVKICAAPEGSEVGDRVYLKDRKEGSFVDAPGRINDKQWKKIVDGLAVLGGVATYNKIPLVTDKGEITVPDLQDGAEIH